MMKIIAILIICTLSLSATFAEEPSTAKAATVPTRFSITSSPDQAQTLTELPATLQSINQTNFHGDLQGIRERRLLRVLVTHSRTDFFLDGGRIRGIQAELVQEFVKSLNEGIERESDKIFVQFIPVEFHQLIPALAAGQGDIAAAILTATPERAEQVDFVVGQNSLANEVIVRHKDAPLITSKGALSGKEIYALRSSSYVKHLRDINQLLVTVDLPIIKITESDHSLLTEDILELVNAGILDYTVCDDFKAKLWAQVLPNIEVLDKVAISEQAQVGWAIRKQTPELSLALSGFMKQVKRGTLMGNMLFARYFNNTHWIDNPDLRLERDKLAKFIHLFEKYGSMYDFDPLALAAQAYQESRLDQSMRSHRGAVGIMQVLPSTATDPNVGVANIDQLEANIHAGTKYMNFLRSRYFNEPEIKPLDQGLFAWAAYNAGPAAVIRLRKAARKKGLNPNIWFANVEVMAAQMISREPVRYVANIYKYYTAYRLIQQRAGERQIAIDKHLEKST